MRGSTAIALSIGIGALIGATVMGVPAIRNQLITAPATTQTQTATADVAVTKTPDAETLAATVPSAPAFDVKAALQDRVLGNPDAPVTFYDYSSLSCPHCAQFHTTTLTQIRQHYIDKGTVKMVFRPFPLNESALMGEKIARCAPADQYFNMLDLLFKNQDKWAFDSNAKENLRQIVKVAGINDELFDSCMANTELEKGIMDIASQGVERHNLKGTPSFVFGSDMPNSEVVAGELDFSSFSKRLDDLLAKQQ